MAEFEAEIEAARAELLVWESEGWDDEESRSWLSWYRSYLDDLTQRTAADHADDTRWLAEIVVDLKAEGPENIRGLLNGLGPGFAALLTDAQELRDREWVTTTTAARIYGCSPSYMRRMARKTLGPQDRRLHPDGSWRIRCGAIRRRRKS